MARDLIENEKLVRLSRSLHAAWRDAVRTPWRNLRRRLRDALPVSSEGVPVALDEATVLAVVPYEGGLPPPLSGCEVVAPAQYRTRLHPLSVNSTNAERVHYIDHTVHAPAMTLEHLVNQYWFPAFGLLISPEGRVCAPFVPWPLSGGVLVVDQGDRQAAASRRNAGAATSSRAARARATHRRRAFADRRVGQAQLRPLLARYCAADRARRADGRANADLEAATLAAGSDRPARGSGWPHPRDSAKASLSRTCDHIEQVHGPKQPERASPKP